MDASREELADFEPGKVSATLSMLSAGQHSSYPQLSTTLMLLRLSLRDRYFQLTSIKETLLVSIGRRMGGVFEVRTPVFYEMVIPQRHR
jgi:hypothetical protein